MTLYNTLQICDAQCEAELPQENIHIDTMEQQEQETYITDEPDQVDINNYYISLTISFI